MPGSVAGTRLSSIRVMSARGITSSVRRPEVELGGCTEVDTGDDLLEASLPAGASLAEVVVSVFVLAGDFAESTLVASLFASVLKASFFVVDLSPEDVVLDDGSGDDG